jgi:hypothetical protein
MFEKMIWGIVFVLPLPTLLTNPSSIRVFTCSSLNPFFKSTRNLVIPVVETSSVSPLIFLICEVFLPSSSYKSTVSFSTIFILPVLLSELLVFLAMTISPHFQYIF